MMKIDVHVHCSEYSGCGRSPATAMIESATQRGLDALVFTNHWRFISPEDLARWSAAYAPFRVFNGIEVTTCQDDYLVLGVFDPALESCHITYDRLRTLVSEQGGCLIWAHPFRYHDGAEDAVWQRPPDAIEQRSFNIRPDTYERIVAAQARLGRPAITSSDAHAADTVGLHCIELHAPVADERELARAIRAGAFDCRTDFAESSAKPIL